MNFKKGSWRTYRYNANALRKYALETHANEIFCEKMAAEFLKAKYDYPPRDTATKMGSHARYVARTIRLLGEMHIYGTLASAMRPNAGQIWVYDDKELFEM